VKRLENRNLLKNFRRVFDQSGREREGFEAEREREREREGKRPWWRWSGSGCKDGDPALNHVSSIDLAGFKHKSQRVRFDESYSDT